jgi:hypothetical protein
VPVKEIYRPGTAGDDGKVADCAVTAETGSAYFRAIYLLSVSVQDEQRNMLIQLYGIELHL